MRHAGPRSVAAVALRSAMTVLLVSVPHATTANPVSLAKWAVCELGPIARNYASDLQDKREKENVGVRLLMHNGDPRHNGCGFYFQVTGYAGGFGSGYFPAQRGRNCSGDVCAMRLTRPSAVHETSVRLGNEEAESVEIHVDGTQNTGVKVACFGFNERTILGGPRAFCVNGDLLKSCKALTGKWDAVDVGPDDLTFTQTTRGVHKIVIRDVWGVIKGFRVYEQDFDDNSALRSICDRIDLVQGRADASEIYCPATSDRNSRVYRKNPYDCDG